MLLTLLKKAMQDRRLSVRQVAAEIGVSHTTIIRLLDGASYDLDTAKLVCKWLGVPPAQVLGLSGSDPMVEALSSILSTNPPLHTALQEVLAAIQNNQLDITILENILQYIAFLLHQAQPAPQPPDEPKQTPFLCDTLGLDD